MYFYRIEITFVRYFCIFLEVAGFENVVNFQNDQMIPFISFYFFFVSRMLYLPVVETLNTNAS